MLTRVYFNDDLSISNRDQSRLCQNLQNLTSQSSLYQDDIVATADLSVTTVPTLRKIRLNKEVQNLSRNKDNWPGISQSKKEYSSPSTITPNAVFKNTFPADVTPSRCKNQEVEKQETKAVEWLDGRGPNRHGHEYKYQTLHQEEVTALQWLNQRLPQARANRGSV